MDNELKIVLSTELEADEQASAQRIASQLPAISEKVNAKSNIKIGVELERNATQNVTQQINRELSKASRQAVGVSVKLDTSAIQKFQSELDKLGVNDKVTQAISAEMDSMGVRIDQISGAWKEAAEGERQLLNLTIQGTDQLGRKVTVAKQFAYTLDEETAELKEQSSTITRMTADLEKQRQAAERLAAQEEKDNQKRLNDVASYEASLQRLQALYNGEKGTKPLTDQLHLDDVIAKYSQVEEAVAALKAKQGAASEEEKRNIETQISELELLVQKYQNVEYIATKLRTKTVVQVNTEQVEKLKEFEERLRSAGILTQEFQDKINNLRGDLGKAFDNKSLTEYLNGFDRLQSDVASFQEKIRSINSIYTELGKISSEINTIQRELVGLNPSDDASRISALKEQLAIYEQQKAQLEAQLVPYGTMLDYAKQKTVYDQQAKVLAGELAIAEAAVADNAAKIDTAMQSIPSAVEAIRARFAQLANPTQELIRRVSELDAEMRAVSEARTDQEKIAAYQKLAETIKYCRTEITNLSTAQRKDILDVKFTAGLEKAKADLATIARTWSAFKQDEGLNAQFKQLSANLQRVSNQADLTKWTAQFNAFKSEVKSAGLNVQSLADTLKNNLGKVLQWVSATTLLFRAFRLLKTAVSTVVNLNTAMVDLRKVTTGTTADYEAFYQSANDTAKALNATTEAVISQTAEWARLGYSLKDAAKLAENAMVFAAVSPGMDQTAATDGLVSIIKAYGIEIEDTMDGIISKVNDIGNKFAVSNADIVEALTRSSSAMAAANNTFEETVALATAAIEITRDANGVGNALKTLSMRIRGYDEETEEYSEDIAILTGKIADFTRTASNPTGVTLFTDATNQTYKSTYEILSDIADVFDEISDVDQARLLENLFGKRQAQVGAAILSNFDQARKSIETMENSAGSAGREMEKIMDSLDYRINALKETWTGVAQNLFQQEDLKVVIGALTTLSNLVDALTSKLGLFGTVTLAGTIVWLAKVRSAVGAINTAITPVMQTVANINFDGSAASALQYAAALSGLDAAQQKVVMSASGLSAAEQAQVMDMMKVIAVTNQYTVAELEKALGMEAGTLAASLNVSATAMVTEELLRAAIANGTLSAEQLKAVVSTNAQTGAMIAQAGAAQTLGAAMKSATAAMLTNPIGWITLAIGLIPLLISGISKLIVTQEEEYEEAEKLRSKYEETQSELESLEGDLKTNKDRISELQTLSRNGTITLIEQEELDRLQRTNAELETTIARKKELADMDAAEVNKGFAKAFGKESFTSTAQERLLAEQRTLYEQYGDLIDRYKQATSGYGEGLSEWAEEDVKKAEDAINRLFYISNTINSGYDQSTGRRLANTVDFETHVKELVDVYNELNDLQESGVTLSTAQKDLFAYTRAELVELADTLADDYLGQYIGEDENTELWQSLLDSINKTIYAAEYFSERLTEIPQECHDRLTELGSSSELTADKVNELALQFPQLKQWMDESGYSAEDVAANFNALSVAQEGAADSTDIYTASLSDLTEVLSKLKSSYDALEAAETDMAGGGLTLETIEKLADVEENYLAYLYEENGIVKLNTEAWKENANAKMLGEIDEIQREIDALEAQNDALRENIAYYEEQRQLGNDGGLWSGRIAQTTADIEENNRAIEENQGKLALYSSLYGSITGDMDAYTAALQNFSNVATTIDNITGSFQALANLQTEVADEFTMSLERALEFASVYPEIMNSAQVCANGQIKLNADVVNSFIEGKKAELDAEIDSQVAVLESRKAVLEARLAFSQAELELAKSVGEGEAQIAKEVAEFRLDTANQLVAALIDAGVDEATAFQLACEAMAGNAEEFDRIAMEVCTDVNGNFNKAAFQAAQAIYQNMNSAKKDVASLATQAQQTAEAIAGMADGIKRGSTAIVAGSGGGTSGSGIALNLTGADFKGTDYTYEAKSLGLDEFISDLELDISNYQNAISQIDGQIAALQALKNTPLKSFEGTGSGGSGSSSKEVEEYIADIDKYREAIEALRKAQVEAERIEGEIENAGSYEKKIALTKELVEAYKAEQAALHNLNDARDATIAESVEALRALGFEVEYNADTNDLWISNMEHLNELVADSKGEYDTLQEATNALRQGTEDLIGTITDLNDANRESSTTWMELRQQIIEATIAQYEYALQVRENAITLAENGMDNAIGTKNLADVKKYSAAIIAEYQGMQKTLHDEADYYRSLGYSETSDEVSKLSDLWWDYADNIKKVKEQVIDYLIDIVDAAHDSVDEIQNVSDALHDAADEFAANDGFITVDTFLALRKKVGIQYMQMLKDENGLWEINEERINDVIAARTRQLAVENAMAYVERLKLAAQEESIEDLDNLCFATTEATNSTWGLVYAELELMHTMGELNDSQYAAALHNIEAMQDLANNVVANIGKATDAVAKNLEETRKQLEETKDGLQDLLDELEDMQDGANDLIKYVMDMLKHRIKEQIDLIEEMKDKYSELIQLKKDSLDATKDEQDYQKIIAKKLKEMAKLQERINALALDDSRSAQAERAKLLEELAELQEDLEDTQADKSVEAQKEALDQMEEDYHAEKDKEIKILEDSISSYQKLYDMAIAYIRDNWDTLYSELIAWNYEYGSVLNSEITAAWEAAQAAAQRYGDFVSAVMGGISAEIDSITAQIEALNAQISNLSTSASSGGSGIGTSGSGTESKNTTVGAKTTSTSPTDEDMVRTIVGRMKEYGAAWSTSNDKATNDALHQKAANLAKQLDQYGVHADFRNSDGTWWITQDRLNLNNVGKRLHSCYHTGGFVGDEPLRPNEQYIKAEKGELVLTSDQQDNVATRLGRIDAMTEKFLTSPILPPTLSLFDGLAQVGRGTINNITNNSSSKPVTINQGDVYIQGTVMGPKELAQNINRYIDMTERMINQYARLTSMKW